MLLHFAHSGYKVASCDISYHLVVGRYIASLFSQASHITARHLSKQNATFFINKQVAPSLSMRPRWCLNHVWQKRRQKNSSTKGWRLGCCSGCKREKGKHTQSINVATTGLTKPQPTKQNKKIERHNREPEENGVAPNNNQTIIVFTQEGARRRRRTVTLPYRNSLRTGEDFDFAANFRRIGRTIVASWQTNQTGIEKKKKKSVKILPGSVFSS